LARRWGALGALCVAMAAAPAAAQGDAAPRFEIRRFVFDGATLVPQARLREATAPFTGVGRDFGDVQRALEALPRERSVIELFKRLTSADPLPAQ